jgi:Bacterial Ig-like domain (group 2)
MSPERLAFVTLSLIAASGLNSCSNESTAPLPQLAKLNVRVSTTGTDLDPDNYSLFIDGRVTLQRDVAINGSTTLTLAAGSYTVALGGVRFNCQVSGANPQTVDVPEGPANVAVQFSVACTQRSVASVLVGPKATSLGVGESLQLFGVPVDLEGSSLEGRVVTWASSSEAKATVSSSGLVLGVAHGSVTITTTAEGKVGSLALEIGDPAASLTVDPPAITIGGATCATGTLTAVLRDANGQEITGRQVKWSTSDDRVAVPRTTIGVPASTVRVYPVDKGTATVTASTGLLSSSATVTTTELDPFCFF